MEKSETIGKLAEALSKAQGMIKGAIKDSNNPFFRSTYADLASVWEACREPLSANGLSIVQITEISGDSKLCLVTILLHNSGEYVTGRYPITPMRQAKDVGWEPSNDPQSLGSAITYARRYALSAIIGIAPEDDDGEAAVGRGPKKEPPKVPPKEPIKEQREHQTKQTTKDFGWLERMGKAKKLLGDTEYYAILHEHDILHANEVTDPQLQAKILDEMTKAYNAHKEPTDANKA